MNDELRAALAAGKRLHDIRERLAISHTELAQECGTIPAHILLFEKGGNGHMIDSLYEGITRILGRRSDAATTAKRTPIIERLVAQLSNLDLSDSRFDLAVEAATAAITGRLAVVGTQQERQSPSPLSAQDIADSLAKARFTDVVVEENA